MSFKASSMPKGSKATIIETVDGPVSGNIEYTADDDGAIE